MKKIFLILFVCTAAFCSYSYAQSPQGKNFGFGIMVGDPTGLTVKFWTQRNNALVIDVGGSYFGSTRIGVDYLWHFDAFRSNIAKLYAGFGGALGIGEGKGLYYTNDEGRFFFRSNNGVGIGARGIVGVNVIPQSTPLEIFLEIGVLVGLTPTFGSALDTGLGLRFYP
jgi:hypothetical protein